MSSAIFAVKDTPCALCTTAGQALALHGLWQMHIHLLGSRNLCICGCELLHRVSNAIAFPFGGIIYWHQSELRAVEQRVPLASQHAPYLRDATYRCTNKDSVSLQACSEAVMSVFICHHV